MEMADRETRSKPKKTVIGSFLGRIHRSKSRGAAEKKKDENVSVAQNGTTTSNSSTSVTSSKSDGNIQKRKHRRNSSVSHQDASTDFAQNGVYMSPARKLLNRFTTFRQTGRFRANSTDTNGETSNSIKNGVPVKTTSEHDLHTAIAKTPNTRKTREVNNVGTTGAVSEIDLRYVTSRSHHGTSVPDEMFGFGETSPRAFLSENDLSSGVSDFPEVTRTPSYLRVSCALNGYTRSPKKDATPTSATMIMGESIVQRRLKMFTQPQDRRPDDFGSPMVSTTTTAESTSEEFSTPIAAPRHHRIQTLQNNSMGNQVSTPGPIKDLISKFDQLNLCSSNKDEKEGVENIAPHKLIINQPDFEDVDLKKDANGNEKSIEEKTDVSLKISLDVESDSGISGSGNFSPASSKRAEEIPIEKASENKENQESIVSSTTPSSGAEFQKLHDLEKARLQEKMDAASKDLEIVDTLPERCADSLRAAHGNAHLLVRKKFGKFCELIEKNLHPIADDPMPVNVPDLEAFWVTIDMELQGILKEFEKLEKFRAANWDENAVEEEKEATIVVPKQRTNIVKKKAAVVMSDEAKEKIEKQRAAAEQRRSAMREQMKQKMMQMKQTEEEPVLGASEEC